MNKEEFKKYLVEELNWPEKIAADYVEWLVDRDLLKKGGSTNE